MLKPQDGIDVEEFNLSDADWWGIFFLFTFMSLTLSPLGPASPRDPCSPGGPCKIEMIVLVRFTSLLKFLLITNI